MTINVLFENLKNLYETNKAAVLVEHNPMSQRYRRAERRLLRILCEGKAIASSARQQITSDKQIDSIHLIIWIEPDSQMDEEFGHYIVFDLFFSQGESTLLSATLFCYYDGQDNSSIKLKTESDAINFSKKLYP